MNQHNVRRVNVPWFNDGMTEAEVECVLNIAMDAYVEMTKRVTRKRNKNTEEENSSRQSDENKENIPPEKRASKGIIKRLY